MDNHLFIVTYGRTGSTLLLGILNAHAKIHISGENNGLFYQLYRSLEVLNGFATYLVPPAEDTPAFPFYGISGFPFNKTRDEISRMFENFFPAIGGIETHGFKEIRYDMQDLENYLNFLANRFENTRFVFLTRDHQSVAKSGFYKTKDPASIAKHLAVYEKRFRDYAERNPQISFQIRYEELLDFGRISELFNFIGHQAVESIWRDTVSEKHSYDHKTVVGISKDSNLVFFDSAQRLIETYHFEVIDDESKDPSRSALNGVILPRVDAGPLTSLFLQNTYASHQAKLGIQSPYFVTKYPDHPLAGNARFSFAHDPPDLRGGTGDYDLVATFHNGPPEIIGRLFVAPDPGPIL